MVRSMTGFGRSEVSDANYKITVEMKAVNHRYLDLNIKMPKKFNPFESNIRNVLKEDVNRGKVDVYVTCENLSESLEDVRYNKKIAETYYNYITEISKDFDLPMELTASRLSRYPDVFTTEDVQENEDELWELLEKALREAMKNFVAAREKEGQALYDDLIAKLDAMQGYVDIIETKYPQVVADYRKRLEDKVMELLADTKIDENRIASEVTIYADKICVDEETVRLKAHIKSVKDTLKAGGACGRKLDFIAQELNRESNTILSKSTNAEIADVGISLKTDVEKVREQIQNIE